MAGSRKWMIYETDGGTDYAVRIDESNGEACGFGDVTDANVAGLNTLPRGLEMRYVNGYAVGRDGEIYRRKLNIGSLALFNQLKNGTATIDIIDPYDAVNDADAVQTTPFNVTSFRGERQTKPIAIDTQLTDGDVT